MREKYFQKLFYSLKKRATAPQLLEGKRSVFVWSPILLSAVSHTLKVSLLTQHYTYSTTLEVQPFILGVIIEDSYYGLGWKGPKRSNPPAMGCPPLDQVAQGEITECFNLMVSSPTTS